MNAENLKDRIINDFKKLVSQEIVQGLGKYWVDYEKKAQSVLKAVELRTKDAKKLGKVQVERFGKQLEVTRRYVENRVVELVSKETVVVNKKLQEVVSYVKTLAEQELQTRAKEKGSKNKPKKAAKKVTKSPTAKKQATKSNKTTKSSEATSAQV